MKKAINILGRSAVVFMFALVLESLLTAGYIYNVELWDYWLAWVVQGCYLLLQAWAVLIWCEEDRIV